MRSEGPLAVVAAPPERGWAQLALAHGAFPMQDCGWASSCIEAFGPTGTVEILTVGDSTIARMIRLVTEALGS